MEDNPYPPKANTQLRNYLSVMKFYFSLLSILSTVISAKPAMVHHRSTDIEKPADSYTEGQYGARGISVERQAEQSGHDLVSHLERGISPICSHICGKASDCVPVIEFQAQQPDEALCANDAVIVTVGSECQLTFGGHHSSEVTCISQARFAGLGREVFDACMNNDKVGFGGCVDLGDGGHVCLRNNLSSSCD